MDLIINSHEGDIYLVSEQAPEYAAEAKARSPTPHKRFSSLSSIKQHYLQRRINKVWLVQRSAYDEMCGLNSSAIPMMMELRW